MRSAGVCCPCFWLSWACYEAECHAGFEARGDGQQATRLVRTHHLRYLLRLTEMIDLGGKIQPPQRHAEQEPRSGHDAVAIANTHARLGQVQLEQPNVLGCSRVGGPL